jgi:hypothetical protein
MTSEESKALDDYLAKYNPAGYSLLGFPLEDLTVSQLRHSIAFLCAWNKTSEEISDRHIQFVTSLLSQR